MRKLFSTIIGLSLICTLALGSLNQNSSEYSVATTIDLQQAVGTIKSGDILYIEDGVYEDLKLIINNSGSKDKPITICAKNRGEVFFTGDVKVEIRGEHIVLDGIYFKDGDRNPDEWKSHGPGLVAIYGSYNRLTQCAFHAFDQANSAYVTTSLTEDGKVPQHCRIDHCSFTEKITFDQVINLNNKAKKEIKGGAPGIPMYHRIDHCYFSNPKKPGNAGGGIRVGYWRDDYGRCLIDNNLFERQDSEPEIVTSKSMENVYYNNTFLNCAGTLNFRHGDKQVAVNNFFIGDDTLNEYGGMFVWGSNHIIANNYFNLPTTLKSRGSAALFLNSGAVGVEHALAFDLKIYNNIFDRNNGYAINFSALHERRIAWCAEKGLKLEDPRDLSISNNLFISRPSSEYSLFYKHDNKDRKIDWSNNIAIGGQPGFSIEEGISSRKYSSSVDGLKDYSDLFNSNIEVDNTKLYNIEGIDLDICKLVNEGIKGEPLTRTDVGPEWLEEFPGTYADKGRLSKKMQKLFKQVTSQRK